MTRLPTLAQAIKNALFVFVLTVVCTLLFSFNAYAAIPQTISYQARLWTTAGVPVGDATYPLKFSLYTAASGGTPIWTADGDVSTPTAISVSVVNGSFTVLLGDVSGGQNSLADVDWNQGSLYLGITVDTDSEMSPRRPLSSVPQAFLSDNALRIQGMSPSSTAYGGQTLFTIHQTETSAATGTRSALDVHSEGTSSEFDYLLRGINDLGTTVFSLNRAGNVTSTGGLSVGGRLRSGEGLYVDPNGTFYGGDQLTSIGSYTASTTLALNLYGGGGLSRISLDGDGIVLGAGAIRPLTDLGGSLGDAATRFNAYLGTVTSTRVVSDIVSTTQLNANAVQTDSLQVAATLFANDILATGNVQNHVSAVGITSASSYATALPGIAHMQVVGDRLYVQSSSTISIFDISDPSTEKLITTIQGAGIEMKSLAVRGNMIYFVYNDTLGGSRHVNIADVTNPLVPVYYGGITLPFAALTRADIKVFGNALYVSSAAEAGILVYDISDLASPVLANTLSLSSTPEDLQVDSRGLYVTTSDGINTGYLRIFHTKEPLNPVLVSTVTVGIGARATVLKGNMAYVLNTTDQTISAVDVTNIAAATVAETHAAGASPNAGVLVGDRLLVGHVGGTLSIFNVSSQTAMTDVGATVVQSGVQVQALAVSGRKVLIGVASSPYIVSWKLPGVTVDAFEAGQAELFSLNVRGEVRVQDSLQVSGGIGVGFGGISSMGSITSYVNTPTSTAGRFINDAADSTDTGWGLFTNRLLVGSDIAATGSKHYVASFVNDSSVNQFGVCIDDLTTASTCLDFASTSTAYSLMADDAIGANAFDLAERYAISGEASAGDVLVLDSDQAMRMKKSTGIPYDDHLSGVVSTRPGFVLGTGGDVAVALVGRVPVNVTVANGVILPGDALTSSEIPGYAMKATRAGKIIGRALEGATADGRIEVYLQPGFDASPLLQADGGMTVIAQDAGFQATRTATVDAPAQSSRALSFRGSAWDGSAPVVSEFRLYNQVSTPADAALSVAYGASSSSIFALTSNGSLTLAGDLALAGRLYPSARGQAQYESYLFVDDTQPGARYVSTNADGWQSQDGYDYAERYQSPDKLEPGDLVVVRRSERLYVQRSLNDTDMLVGIVSTKPGFVAGKTTEDSYPIALAGRVPTKVSTMNGAIEPGDPLAPSSIPGVAVKATKPGPIVGLALDAYADADVGKIEVFVNPTWWGGETTGEGSVGQGSKKQSQGFGEITSGKTRVHVRLTGFIAYPHLQVTPYAQMEHGWWIENVAASGFDLVLGGAIGHNARFAWSAQETADNAAVSLSNGQTFNIDPISGQIQFPPGASDAEVVQESVAVEEPPVAIVEPAPSSSELEVGSASSSTGLVPATESEPESGPLPVPEPEPDAGLEPEPSEPINVPAEPVIEPSE